MPGSLDDLPFLREGAFTHNVSQERPGAFTLTPRTASPEDRATFQDLVKAVLSAESRGLVRCLVHRAKESPDLGVDLVFVVVTPRETDG